MTLFLQFRRFLKSFSYATKGMIYCIKYERNFRVHLCMFVAMLYFSQFYSFSCVEFAIFILTSGLVMVAEAVNTAIETVTDKASPEKSELAKISKDVAAGAVMIGAIVAVIVGFCLFYDPVVFTKIFNHHIDKPLSMVLLAVLFVLSVVFVFSPKSKK